MKGKEEIQERKKDLESTLGESGISGLGIAMHQLELSYINSHLELWEDFEILKSSYDIQEIRIKELEKDNGKLYEENEGLNDKLELLIGEDERALLDTLERCRSRVLELERDLEVQAKREESLRIGNMLKPPSFEEEKLDQAKEMDTTSIYNPSRALINIHPFNAGDEKGLDISNKVRFDAYGNPIVVTDKIAEILKECGAKLKMAEGRNAELEADMINLEKENEVLWRYYEHIEGDVEDHDDAIFHSIDGRIKQFMFERIHKLENRLKND